jgi:hypothetical protein
MAATADQSPDQSPVQALTIPEAARCLGVSEVTIRRRIRSKQVAAQRVRTPRGHEWRVLLPVTLVDAAAGEGDGDHQTGRVTDHGPSAREYALLEQNNADLRAQLTELRGELDARRREVGELHVLLARWQPALPGPVSVGGSAEPDGPDDQGDQGDDHALTDQADQGDQCAETITTSQRRWWSRAWSWLAGD